MHFFIYYLYVYRGDSLTLGNRYLIRFFGVANVFLSARDVEMFVNVLGGFWEGNAYLTSTHSRRVATVYLVGKAFWLSPL